MCGTMTWDEFLKDIYEIKEFSDKINDEWQLVIDEKHTFATGYIYLKKCIKQRVNLEDVEDEENKLFGNNNNKNNQQLLLDAAADHQQPDYNLTSLLLFQDDDISTINNYTTTTTTINNKQLTILCYEYHLIFNISYQVPILYFNAYKSNGSLLTLDECWKIFIKQNPIQVSDESLDMKMVLTQMEHPILFKPFFTLHPCRTANILENIPKSKNKVLSFLSAIGPTILLNMNLLYGNNWD